MIDLYVNFHHLFCEAALRSKFCLFLEYSLCSDHTTDKGKLVRIQMAKSNKFKPSYGTAYDSDKDVSNYTFEFTSKLLSRKMVLLGP